MRYWQPAYCNRHRRQCCGYCMWSYNVRAITRCASRDLSHDFLRRNESRFCRVRQGTARIFMCLLGNAQTALERRLANRQSVARPERSITTFVTAAPAATSGPPPILLSESQPTPSLLPTSTTPMTPPMSANDSGVLYRIKNVFCTLPAACVSNAAPSLDTTWGTGGAVTVCTGKLTGPSPRLHQPERLRRLLRRQALLDHSIGRRQFASRSAMASLRRRMAGSSIPRSSTG